MLSLIKKYNRGTCSVFFPRAYCLTFANSERYLKVAKDSGVVLAILVPKSLRKVETKEANCLIIPRENHLVDFIHYHNTINKDKERKADIICTRDIDPTASIANDGMRYNIIFDKLVGMKHMGGVVIANGVVIGPFSSVAKATLDYTVIGKDTKIGCSVHIGHNVQIGERNIITDGTIIGGSAIIGSDCFFGLGSKIRNGVSICDKVLIGMGAVITKDITEPGIYAGCPMKYFGEWDGKW